MKQFEPTISRVNKVYDKHNNIVSVEFFNKLESRQRILLDAIITIWTGNVNYNQAPYGMLPHNVEELTKKMRLVLRTKEYSEKLQPDLMQIRDWYIDYKRRIKK
jgi:hypothetical protein